MFVCFLVCFFSKINVFKILFQKYKQGKNILDLDQARYFVEPNLDPNCYQQMTLDVYSSIYCESLFLACFCLLLIFLNHSLQNSVRMPSGLDPAYSDLGTNRLQMLSADGTGRLGVSYSSRFELD